MSLFIFLITGDEYNNVTSPCLLFYQVFLNILLAVEPKSINIGISSDFNIFCGFKSLWIKPVWWKHLIDFNKPLDKDLIFSGCSK